MCNDLFEKRYGLLFPALLHDKYSENFSLGLVTTGGSLGLLFAPSVPLIIYGVITETPIFDMFIAGALPGILMVIILFILARVFRHGAAMREDLEGTV